MVGCSSSSDGSDVDSGSDSRAGVEETAGAEDVDVCASFDGFNQASDDLDETLRADLDVYDDDGVIDELEVERANEAADRLEPGFDDVKAAHQAVVDATSGEVSAAAQVLADEATRFVDGLIVLLRDFEPGQTGRVFSDGFLALVHGADGTTYDAGVIVRDFALEECGITLR